MEWELPRRGGGVGSQTGVRGGGTPIDKLYGYVWPK